MRKRPAVSPGSGGERSVVVGVSSATLLIYTGVGSTLPVLPQFVAGPLQGDAVTVGLVMGCYTASGLLARPFAGRSSDRRGRRPVVLAALAVIVASGVLLYLSTGVAGVLVSQLVLGLGRGSMNTVFNLWMLDSAPLHRRGQVIGLLGVSIWAGYALGPLVGVWLLHQFSYGAVWLFAIAAPAVAAVIVLRVPDDRSPVPADTGSALFPRVAVPPGLALLLTNIGWGTASAFIVLHLVDRGVGGAVAVFTAYGLAIVATRVVAGHLPDVIGPRRAVVAGGIAQTAGLVLLAVASSSVIAVAGGLALGFGTSMLFPSLALMVVRRAAPAERGAAVGAFTSFFDAGVGLGAPLAGLVAAAAGYEAAFWMAAACAAAGTLVGAIAGRPPDRPAAG